MTTICDPQANGGHPIEVPEDWRPNPGHGYLPDGFIWFQGALREVREVHVTENGVQYELI